MSCRPRRSIASPMVVGDAVLTVGRLRCRRFGLLEAVSCVSADGFVASHESSILPKIRLVCSGLFVWFVGY